MDPFHPSQCGLNKYKEYAWDAVGEAGCLSIKILDGWNFTENTNTKKGTCTFESYAREMRILFSTTCVGHAIDVLEMMVQYPKRCVPLSMKFMPGEIASPVPNLAAERNTASGQGSGGMGEETSGKADAEARGRELKEAWNKPASPPQKEEGTVIDAEKGWRLKGDARAGARAREQNLREEQLKNNPICQAGRNRSNAAAYRQRVAKSQDSGTVSGQVASPSSVADACLAPGGPRPVASCSAQDRGQDSRTASGQVGFPLPLLAPPPPLSFSAALDACGAPPIPATPDPPAQALPVKGKPRNPPQRPFPPPPPPAPFAKGTWGHNGQNWWEIDPEDDEEARKRETAPIEVFLGAE